MEDLSKKTFTELAALRYSKKEELDAIDRQLSTMAIDLMKIEHPGAKTGSWTDDALSIRAEVTYSPARVVESVDLKAYQELIKNDSDVAAAVLKSWAWKPDTTKKAMASVIGLLPDDKKHLLDPLTVSEKCSEKVTVKVTGLDAD
jgi:hypothetical protein